MEKWKQKGKGKSNSNLEGKPEQPKKLASFQQIVVMDSKMEVLQERLSIWSNEAIIINRKGTEPIQALFLTHKYEYCEGCDS